MRWDAPGEDVMLGDMTEQSDESQGPLLSVRSEVERIVDPDSAVLQRQISIVRDTMQEALRAAAVALDSLKNDLQDLGGVTKSAATHVQPLTWSTQRIITMPEYDNSLRSNTGRTVANVTVHLSLRDFSLLERIEELAADQNHFRIIHTSWSVDNDNPGQSQPSQRGHRGGSPKGRGLRRCPWLIRGQRRARGRHRPPGRKRIRT